MSATQRRLRCLAFIIIGVLLSSAGVTPRLAAAQEPTPQSVPGDRLDLNDDGLIDTADATDVAVAADELHVEGMCIRDSLAEQDVNGDGCVDVQDIQTVFGQWGQLADPNQPEQVGPAALMEITVNSNGNSSDADTNDGVCATSGGDCTLRAALETANKHNGEELIKFAIPGCGNNTIATPSELKIGGDGFTTIDGYTQCGAKPNDANGTYNGNAVLKIEIIGTAPYVYNISGIEIQSPNNTIRGIAIKNFDRHIKIQGAVSYNNRIQGNWVGIDLATNPTPAPVRDPAIDPTTQRFENHFQGVFMTGGAQYNIIGCGTHTGPAYDQYQPCQSQDEFNAARNILSGNFREGFQLEGGEDPTNMPAFNRIVGNYIGVLQDGRTRRQNRTDGTDMNRNVQDNWLGGELTGAAFGGQPGERNIITGNTGEGLELSHGNRSLRNRVTGNYFGLNAYGEKTTLGNSGCGISMEDSTQETQIYNNVVANNGGCGVRLQVNIRKTEVFGNYIGVGPDGVTSMPNGVLPQSDPSNPKYPDGRMGVYIYGGSQNNVVRNNIIANHPTQGVLINSSSFDPWIEKEDYPFETRYNVVSQNSIYNNNLEAIELGTNDNPDPGGIQDYVANDYMARPVIAYATQARVVGTGAKKDRRDPSSRCVGCQVEVFISEAGDGDAAGGEGKTFLGSGTTDSGGNWVVNTCGKPMTPGQKVTATITDYSAGEEGYGNTSEFAANVDIAAEVCQGPPPTTVPTVTPIIGPPPPPTVTPTTPPSGPTVTPTPQPLRNPIFVPGIGNGKAP